MRSKAKEQGSMGTVGQGEPKVSSSQDFVLGTEKSHTKVPRRNAGGRAVTEESSDDAVFHW